MKGSFKDRIRPLWIILSSRWGGPEQVAISDIVELTGNGVPISLMCLEGSPVHAAALRHPGIQVFPVIEGPTGLLDWGFARIIRETIENSQANIVHLNDQSLLWHLERALFRSSEVSILLNSHSPADRSLKDRLTSFLLRRIDYIIVLNESIKQSLLRDPIVPEKKIRVINLGLDFSRFDPAKAKGVELRESWGADKDTVVIGSVGRLASEAGQTTFIKAAAGLLKHKERKMHFVVVGEDPVGASEKYIEELQNLISQFHMEKVVTFTSLSDNLPDFMSAFDVYVMPGREEVPGLGALEALAMERPVVLSNIVGSADIVGNSEFGLLVRPEDAFDLQQKILNLLENPSMRLAMGVEGRKYVLKHFDKKMRNTRFLDVYEKCAKRRLALHERNLSI